jgi:DNA helicase-2/ATP-dependent DNA helicase PcrA
MDYTDAQRKAIETIDSNLQIIACAGSGKTQVISERIVWILKNKPDVTMANIVAFTFTEKAAGELKDRVHRLCREQLGTERGLAEMFVGTIHAFCLDLLQSPPLYRYLKYTVLSDVQQRLLIDRYSQKSGLSQVPLLAGGLLARWKDSRLYQSLLGICAEGSVDLAKVPPGVKAAIEQYSALMHSKRFLDYAMIVGEAVNEIRTHKELRATLANRVKYLVVDEYQDVNPLQEGLIRELRKLGANLCVVGDDDQTIYQWRGSEISNIISFAKRYRPVEQVPLNDNFRSSKGIVLSARKVVELNAERLPKKMVSTDAQEYERGDVLAISFSDPDAEARWIAGRIKELCSTRYQDKADQPVRGLLFSDFAILLRSVRHDGQPILAALDEAGIKYVVGGMNGLFDTPEVAAMRKAFYFMANVYPDGEELSSADVTKILAKGRLGLSSKQVRNGIQFLGDRKAKIGPGMNAALYLQRVYLDLLEVLAIREELIDAAEGQGTGEIVYFNLGKFSQVISDYEQIHFNSPTNSLYESFANFLHYQAPDYYPEGWIDQDAARPNAVQVMTVHQAKGMQWPAVFIPCLRRNRFPSRPQGGRQVWHVIPEEAVANADRYRGTVDDERRLFYVALTRAEKYLACTFAPIQKNQQQRKISQFIGEFTASEFVLTKPTKRVLPKTTPAPRREDDPLALTFSELKYFFSCPYLFKLRFLYGFDAPISRALGYGKSLHDALAEIHSESVKGRIPTADDVERLVSDHLHLPFANDEVKEFLGKAAKAALTRYLRDHGDNLKRLEHVEKTIELKLEGGVVVSGRVDLIRRTDTGETVIVDFKSDERAQAEDISQRQLHVYAVGYQQLTGKNADLIEIHNLDQGGTKREVVDGQLIRDTMATVADAGRRLRTNELPRLPRWCATCSTCDTVGICRTKAASGGR